MAKINLYCLVTPKGNPITIDDRLPIYWNIEQAVKSAKIFKCKIAVILIPELKLLLSKGKTGWDFRK
jgi:hypothetical protein